MNPKIEKQLANIPPFMRNLSNWIVFKIVKRGNKLVKIPYQPAQFKDMASTTNALHWTSFEKAVECWLKHDFDGVGFVFNDYAGVIGIDLDHCIDDDGVLSPYAASMIADCDTYCEVSPSGKGLHLYCLGSFDGPGVKTNEVEIYCRERYFTVTGEVFGEKRPLAEAADRVYETVTALKSDTPDEFEDQKEVSHPPDTNPTAKIENIRDYQFGLANEHKFNLGEMIARLAAKGQGKDLWMRACFIKDDSQSGYDYMLAVLGIELGFSKDEIQWLIWNHRKLYGKDYRKAERQDYIDRTYRKAKAYLAEQEEYRTVDLEVPYKGKGLEVEIEPDEEIDEYFDWGAEMANTPPEYDWLIKDLITENGVHFLVGPPGSKKTFLALDVALSIASGHQWQGRDTAQGQVIWLAGENKEALNGRIRGWLDSGRPQIEKEAFAVPKSPVIIDHPPSLQKLCHFVDQIEDNIKLIVIDTKTASTIGSDCDARDASDFMRAFHDLARRYQCAVLVIDHTPVDNPTRMRGSSIQAGGADSVILFVPDEANENYSNLTWYKSPKDEPIDKDGFAVGFTSIELPSQWNHKDGSTRTTLVPHIVDDRPINREKPMSLNNAQEVVLRTIAESHFAQFDELVRRDGVTPLHITIEVKTIRGVLNDAHGSIKTTGKRNVYEKNLDRTLAQLHEMKLIAFDSPVLSLLPAGKKWIEAN